jgi:beta-glucosidase
MLKRNLVIAALLASAGAAGLASAEADARTRSAAPGAAASAGSPDARAASLVRRMTQDEKLSLVFGYFASDWAPKNMHPPANARDGSAGYVPGIARLRIPPQWETDAGVGVASQGSAKQKRERTTLPSNIATAATWNPEIGFAGGRMIGAEARSSGFNVMLAGGVNLLRDPRNGRNFEYGGEDPLLAGTMVGAQIAGIQSNNIISTTKHYAINDLETGRDWHDAIIDHDAARMSDLLAFQVAIEKGKPGSVMCSYNQVNGLHSCENRWLLTDVLRGAFRYPGYVMSDWGGTHSTEAAANAGLEQDSGYPFDEQPYFGAPLKAAVAAGRVSPARLDEMARRIVRSMAANGLIDHPVVPGPIDYSSHAAVSQADAEQAAVLLKNDGNVLPLNGARRIVLIGGHADKGVLSGGGSSQVYPIGGNAVPGIAPTSWPGPVVYFPSAPLAELRRLHPEAQISFVDGSDPAAAAAAARAADVAIVFVTQWTSESIDTSLTAPDKQDALVEAVAAANPRTVAVLETGGPILMPWAPRVAAILEAWYPGTNGGAAIANLLSGRVSPSGRLPVTFPMSEAQLPRPVRPGTGLKDKEMFSINYAEGATVGYKWFDARQLTPRFPFGHGLSYSSFTYSDLRAATPKPGVLTVRFTVRNSGSRRAMDVPQVYVGPVAGGWEAPKRLGGFSKIDLAPGESRTVSVTVDPRLLATFRDNGWHIAGGEYRVMLGASSRDLRQTKQVRIAARTLANDWRP